MLRKAYLPLTLTHGVASFTGWFVQVSLLKQGSGRLQEALAHMPEGYLSIHVLKRIAPQRYAGGQFW